MSLPIRDEPSLIHDSTSSDFILGNLRSSTSTLPGLRTATRREVWTGSPNSQPGQRSGAKHLQEWRLPSRKCWWWVWALDTTSKRCGSGVSRTNPRMVAIVDLYLTTKMAGVPPQPIRESPILPPAGALFGFSLVLLGLLETVQQVSTPGLHRGMVTNTPFFATVDNLSYEHVIALDGGVIGVLRTIVGACTIG